MGLVRFELTIDGSLRKRHEQHMFSAPTAPHRLPRQARSADPLLIITPGFNRFSAGARRHAGLGHSPGIAILYPNAIKPI